MDVILHLSESDIRKIIVAYLRERGISGNVEVADLTWHGSFGDRPPYLAVGGDSVINMEKAFSVRHGG